MSWPDPLDAFLDEIGAVDLVRDDPVDSEGGGTPRRTDQFKMPELDENGEPPF